MHHSSVAAGAVRYFDRIYHEEGLLANMTAEERYKECLVKIKPLLDELFAWLETVQISRKSALAKAVFLYFPTRWKCTAGQQLGRERDPTVCNRAKKIALQQYCKRCESKCNSVFNRCHRTSKRTEHRVVPDRTVLSACWDDQSAIQYLVFKQ